MRIPLSARIAWRYLRAKKSHSAVGTISVVSICGIAVAVAAIICVLSVFNGFKSIIADRLDTLTPQIMITPVKGKTISNADSLAQALIRNEKIEVATPTILDNALIIYNGFETPVTVKGVVYDKYKKITGIENLIIDSLTNNGNTNSYVDSLPKAVISVGTAARLGIHPGDKFLLFTPRREGRVNLANPASSFLHHEVMVDAVYQSNQSDFDDNRIIIDLDLARDLFQYDSEASAVEIAVRPGTDSPSFSGELSESQGDRYIVRDRLQQQELNFRMISIEKWVSFLLLFFILVIASFNIISSLSMLVIEKEKSIATLRSIGMSNTSIGNIFAWETSYVTAIGGIAGILLGVILCLIQEKFGLIHLQGDPSSLIVSAYPVKLLGSDILLTLIPLFVIGAATAAITSAFARSRN